MKLTFRKTSIIVGVLILAVAALNGCEVDHSLNPYKYGRVYMPQARNNPVKFSAVFSFDTTQTIVYGAAYGGPKRPAVDIPVSFSVNPMLVDSFNTKHLTDYSILPEGSYTLSKKQAVIPSGEKSTSPLKLEIKSKTDIPDGQYLLPVTMKVAGGGKKANGDGFQVNEELKTTYFLIQAHKFRIVADDHKYTAVFADDALTPHYLFFIGYSQYKTGELVWKYDIKGDSLLADYPKKVTDVFKLPYPQTIPHIESTGWFFFSALSPSPQLYFFGNNHYYTYDIETQKAGPLHPITDLSTQPWPPKNFPKRVECAFYAPPKHATYLFTGNDYEKIHTGPLRAWFYPNKGHTGTGGPGKPWPGIPVSFTERGFSGCYYEKASRTIHFFSDDEFVVYDFKIPGTLSDAKKITVTYKGL